MKSAYFNIPRKVEWRESEDLTASGICGPDDYAFRIGEEIGGLRREACASGNPSHCQRSRGCGGEGFTEYLCKKAEWFFPIPGLSAEQGALMEPLTVAMEMIVDGGIREGGTVAILGAGPIGLMAIPICRRGWSEGGFSAVPRCGRRRVDRRGYSDDGR